MKLRLKLHSHQKMHFGVPFSGFIKLVLILFFISFAISSLFSKWNQTNLYAPVFALFETTTKKLSNLQINQNSVFLFSLRENMRLLLLLFFFSFTNVWKLYSLGFCIYSGFSNGLLFSFCIILNGFGGILQFVCFLLPHSLILIPAYLFLLNRLNIFHHQLFAVEMTEHNHALFFSTQKRQLIFRQLPLFLMMIAFFSLASLLEGYLNIPLIKFYNHYL